jgi:hypothetical protein
VKNFFTNSSSPKIATLQQNIINGKTAEKYFAALLTTALDARVNFVSRTDDDAKLDLVTIMSHPWVKNSVEIFFTQVKSGPTYGEVKDEKLIIHTDKLQDLVGRNHSSLICWTKLDDSEAYWFFIKSNARFFKSEYNFTHKLSPLTKFDLTRMVNSVNNKDGGKGLIFNRRNNKSEYTSDDYKILRNNAKSFYAKYKKQDIINPIFGKIEITRLGWKHITRERRWYYYEVASLEIISILDKILKLSPSKHYIIEHENNQDKEYHFRENEFLLSYDNVKVFDQEQKKLVNVRVFVKLLEIGAYLKAWKEKPENTLIANRRVIFKSVYYKQSS